MTSTPISPRRPDRDLFRPWYSLAALSLVACLAAPVAGQQGPVRVKIDKVSVGFPSYDQGDGYYFKADLWAPVLVEFMPEPDGPIPLPVGADDFVGGELLVETPDNDSVPSIYPQKFALRKNDTLQVLSFVKGTGLTASVKTSVRIDGQVYEERERSGRSATPHLSLNDQLYLTVGARLPEFHVALKKMVEKQRPNDFNQPPQQDQEVTHRFAAHVTDPQLLPHQWYGYQAVDLLLLTTDTKSFLQELLSGAGQQRRSALAEWVRRGGRLVVSVSPRHLEMVDQLLRDKTAWQPPLPPLLNPTEKVRTLTEVNELRTFAGPEAFAKPFTINADDPPWVVPLHQRDDIKELAREEVRVGASLKMIPVMSRVPYGLGSVTVLAFDVQGGDGPFNRWNGRTDFYQALVQKLGPKLMVGANDQQQQGRWNRKGGPRGESYSSDLTARLGDELDRFDTAPISFGWVAFFIFLYILVVGPLDYLILKKVFKRLEWTWITFPVVVLTVSVSAYLIAYAVKGNELKINKIDLLDIDLRSDLGDNQQTRKAYVHGTSWFTLLSPRIQSYTIGVEPRVQTWADPIAKEKLSPAMVSWLPRPEQGGNARSERIHGLFRRSYEYDYQALGLKDVPIPVWTTRSFVATWEASLKKIPLEVNLEYDADTLPTGTLKSHLPFDLEEVVLFYGNNWYALSDVPANGAVVPIKLKRGQGGGRDVSEWARLREGGDRTGSDQDAYQPTAYVRDLLFHEKADLQSQYRNHAQRALDQSWRLSETQTRGLRTQEAILFGRVPRARGLSEELMQKGDPRLPTHLWLGQLPGEEQERPALEGTLIQDTYVRIYVPVRPKKQ